MIIKIISFMVMAIMTLVLLWALGWVWFASAIAFGSENDPFEKSDAIIVLTGGNGRVNAGLDLLAEEAAPILFISGVNPDTTKEDIYISWNNPVTPRPCCIELGKEAVDTSSNAAEVENWVKENKIESIILVTSRYHMPRAYLEIRQYLPDLKISQYVTDTSDFQAWQGRFWTLTFSEYNKMLIQAMRFKGYQ